MITVAQVLQALDSAFPFALAEEWDNVGLLLGSREAEVTGIAVALDPDGAALDFAQARGANLLVTHHPILFRARRRLAEEDPEARLLCRMIRQGMALIAAHTNFDNAPGGMNDCLAAALGLEGVEPLAQGLRVGRGSVEQLRAAVEKNLRTPVRAYGAPAGNRIAVCGGAGGEFWPLALEAGANAFVTGEIRYHQALDAAAAGLYVLEAGHAATERVGLAALAKTLPGEVAILG